MLAPSPHRTEPGPHRSLATKIGIIGCLVLLLSLAAIGLTLWVTWQMQGGAAAVNEAGRMRMQTWRLAQALSGPPAPQLPALLAQFDHSLGLLRQGDPARPLAVPRDGSSRQALQAVEAHWKTLRGQWTDPGLALAGGPVPSEVAAQAEAFVVAIDRLVDSIEKQLERWTTLLNVAQFVMMALVIMAAMALLYAAQLLILGPLSRLQAGLARIEAGDLAARVEDRGNDEFATVAAGFNRMAQHLQNLYASLEQRVKNKTRHLETERARLALLYEAAAFASTAGTLEALARGFATQARRAAGADGVAIRWSDEQNRRYVLLASEGLPDDLVEAEHCMPTGACHCGQPQSQARIQEISLSALTGGPLVGPAMATGGASLCQRAGFASVISVPVRLHERIIGEIDLFFRELPDFGSHDRSLIDTLASHLAGGIEGLRAEALQRESAVADERSLLARELHDSIAQGLAFLKIQTGLLRDRLGPVPEGPVLDTLDELDTGIRESLSDVRELLMHFRTRTNAEDIAPALRTTLTKFEHQTGLAAHLDIEGEGLPLPPDVQVQVLHVVQEALSNVRKHARASQVWIDVQQSPQWVVSVRDDGCGLRDAAAAQDETHVGLRIMRERAASIGARLDIASAADAGTCVTLTLPPLLPNA